MIHLYVYQCPNSCQSQTMEIDNTALQLLLLLSFAFPFHMLGSYPSRLLSGHSLQPPQLIQSPDHTVQEQSKQASDGHILPASLRKIILPNPPTPPLSLFTALVTVNRTVGSDSDRQIFCWWNLNRSIKQQAGPRVHGMNSTTCCEDQRCGSPNQPFYFVFHDMFDCEK